MDDNTAVLWTWEVLIERTEQTWPGPGFICPSCGWILEECRIGYFCNNCGEVIREEELGGCDELL